MSTKSVTHRRPRRTRQQWIEIVDRYRLSELTVHDYCEQEDISYASFVKWRCELKNAQPESAAAFIELTPSEVAPPIDLADCLIELNIGSAITLRIRSTG